MFKTENVHDKREKYECIFENSFELGHYRYHQFAPTFVVHEPELKKCGIEIEITYFTKKTEKTKIFDLGWYRLTKQA